MMLVLFPLILAVIQFGLLVLAKNTLNVAALAAARAGAASGGDRAAMRAALNIALAPLHANGAKADIGLGMNDITDGVSGNYGAVMGLALGRSAVTNALYSEIEILNPTAQSFTDFGVKNASGTVIPVDNAYDNATVGSKSKQTRADALLLKIEVRYCEKLIIPIINDIIRAGRSLPSGTLPSIACYADGRVQLTSQAIVRMTVPPVQKKLL